MARAMVIEKQQSLCQTSFLVGLLWRKCMAYNDLQLVFFRRGVVAK
jgi:hypothetical protein